MLAIHHSRAAGFAFAAVAGILLLSTASYAQNRYQQIFPGETYGAAHAQPRARYSPYPTSTPSDYSSSHVCINGYRWITRQQDRWDDPAENAVPVRCN